MKRGFLQLAAVGLVLTAASGAKAAPVTEDNFLLKTTSDLVALCSADKTDPLYTAAVNYCHGFAIGTYRMMEVEDAATRSRHKAICFPLSGITRSQAISNFVTWTADKPNVLDAMPTEGFGQFVLESFACKK